MINIDNYLLRVSEGMIWIMNKENEFLSMDLSGRLIDPEINDGKYLVNSKYELEEGFYKLDFRIGIYADYIKENLSDIPEGGVDIVKNMQQSENEYNELFSTQKNDSSTVQKDEVVEKPQNKKNFSTSKKEALNTVSDSQIEVYGNTFNLYSSTQLNKVYGMNFNTIKRGTRTVEYKGKYILKEDIINNFLTKILGD